ADGAARRQHGRPRPDPRRPAGERRPRLLETPPSRRRWPRQRPEGLQPLECLLVEYRIEQLAQAGGVAVDTIRFYQGKGLLDSPRRDGRVTWYGEHHLERLRRIRDLQQRGFTLAVIRRFLEGELETSDEALVEAVTAPSAPETLALEELASRSGGAVPLLHALEQAGLLLPVADGAEPRHP